MSVRPLGSRVVIEPIEQEEISQGGIIIPEIAKEKPQKGIIIAVGPGDFNDRNETLAMSVTVGDMVLFAKYGGTEIRLDGKRLLILRESDLLAVID